MNRAELSAFLNTLIEQKKKLLLIPGVQMVKCRRDRETGEVKVEVYATENDKRFEELLRQAINPEYVLRLIKVKRKHSKRTKNPKKFKPR